MGAKRHSCNILCNGSQLFPLLSGLPSIPFWLVLVTASPSFLGWTASPLCYQATARPAHLLHLSRPIKERHPCPQRWIQKVLHGRRRSSQSPSLRLFERELGRAKRKKQSFILLSRLAKGGLELLTATSLSRQENPVCGKRESSTWSRRHSPASTPRNSHAL